MLGMCLMRTEMRIQQDRNAPTVAEIKDIYSGEEFFCDYGDKYQLHGVLAGKHDTLAAHRRPPKWYR